MIKSNGVWEISSSHLPFYYFFSILPCKSILVSSLWGRLPSLNSANSLRNLQIKLTYLIVYPLKGYNQWFCHLMTTINFSTFVITPKAAGVGGCGGGFADVTQSGGAQLFICDTLTPRVSPTSTHPQNSSSTKSHNNLPFSPNASQPRATTIFFSPRRVSCSCHLL